jgi:hypothetical protein
MAGGFDEPVRKGKASVVEMREGGAVGFLQGDYQAKHGEADTLVWLHARLCPVSPILIYSPDSDITEIGLLNRQRWEGAATGSAPVKQVYVQIRRPGPDQNVPDVVDINQLAREINAHPDLQAIPHAKRVPSLVTLFALMGCDFVSFFHGISKVQFFELLCECASFISGVDGHTLADWRSSEGLEGQAGPSKQAGPPAAAAGR